MYPHRIRLRGPWECEPLSADSGPSGPRRVTMPSRLREAGLPGFVGKVRLSRKFGYPGRIDAFERVWLTFADIRGVAAISLNSQLLAEGVAAACEFDVTALLKPHNLLQVDLLADSDECGLIGETALEVRCAVFLRDVSVCWHTANELLVTGQAIGTWPEPLDLYILLDDRNAHYAALQAGAEPAAFRALLKIEETEGGHVRPATVRVELVEGPSLWFRVDLPVPVFIQQV